MKTVIIRIAIFALFTLTDFQIAYSQNLTDSCHINTDEAVITYESSPYCITKDDGTKYYIVIKQEKMGKNKYSEYVDAFVIKDGKKIVVSVYDGGDDLDNCGMEVQYNAPSNLEKGQAVIRYNEKERMLYIPRASFQGELSKDECNVFKFDGNMFIRVDIE